MCLCVACVCVKILYMKEMVFRYVVVLGVSVWHGRELPSHNRVPPRLGSTDFTNGFEVFKLIDTATVPFPAKRAAAG